jgi:hypothetical protein
MSIEPVIDSTVAYLTRMTSRRGFLANVAKGVVGAGLLLTGFSKEVRAQPYCANCGGCDSQLCNTTGGSCCPSCVACASTWCFSGTSTCGCPSDKIDGWRWYCCNNGSLWECQDCCDPHTFACVCTSRCNTGLSC